MDGISSFSLIYVVMPFRQLKKYTKKFNIFCGTREPPSDSNL